MEMELNSAKRDPFALDPLHGHCDVTYVYLAQFGKKIKMQQHNNNNIFISYIKHTNITPPANSKANRGRWCVDGLRFITNS